MKVCPSCAARYEDAARFCQHDGTSLQSEGGVGDDDPYVGQNLLGQFEIKEVIGEGGMGRVYKAHQHGFERPVAIKILHKDLVANSEMVQRFNREAKIISRLDHPSIIHVYLFGELPDGNLFLAMEYVDGQSLTKFMANVPISLNHTLHIGRQILDALAEAHRKDVVHRDLKPDNIMLVSKHNNEYSVKVLDFGIAKFLDSRTMLTQQGLVFGSARYISPEAAAGDEVDARADLYAIGIILYQMLAGKPPFDDASAVSLLMRHVNDIPPPLLSRPAAQNVPPAISQVIMQSLEKNPAHRFDDAKAMWTALTEAARISGLMTSGRESDLTAPVWSLKKASTTQKSSEKRERYQKTDPMFGSPDYSKSLSTTQESSVPIRKIAPEKNQISKTEPSSLPSPSYSLPNTIITDSHSIEEARKQSIHPSPMSRVKLWILMIILAILALTGGAVGALLTLDRSKTEEMPPRVGEAQPHRENSTVPATTQNVPPIQNNAQPHQSSQPPITLVNQPSQSASENRQIERKGVGKVQLTTQPQRPRVAQNVKIIATFSPSIKLLSPPQFTIHNNAEKKITRLNVRVGVGERYFVNHSFEKAGTYRIAFSGNSNHGIISGRDTIVVGAIKKQDNQSSAKAQKRGQPTKEPQGILIPTLRKLTKTLLPPVRVTNPSENKTTANSGKNSTKEANKQKGKNDQTAKQDSQSSPLAPPPLF